jgi:DNA invertase Pin-like site-specific DNA recombinase
MKTTDSKFLFPKEAVMKYFLYARKSTDDEDRQILSIEAQLVELRAFAKRENLFVYKELVEKYTAKEPGRPIFNEMIKAIEKGEADALLAWHPDRLARNSVDGGRIIYLLDRGVIKDLKFPTYRLDNNAQGKFMLSIAFGQSKYYIDALSENIRRGIRLKLSKGIWPQWAPVGYLNERQTRTIIIDKDKAPLIKKTFELYATGAYSLFRLRDTVNACGLTGTKGKTLSPGNYQNILRNPIYYGLIRYNGEIYEGKHEPIITKKLFDKCQEVMRRRGKPKKSVRYFILRDLMMRCGECNRMITAETKKGFIYYRCTKRFTNCKQRYTREEKLAAQIGKVIQKVSLCDDWTRKILEQLEKDKNSSVQSSLPQQQNLQAKITEIENRISKLIDVYLEGSLSLTEYQGKKEFLINEKKKLQEALQDFAAGGNNWFEQARLLVTSLNRAHCALKEGNLESQKEFLQKIGSNFILKERRLIFSSAAPYRGLLEGAPYPSWRCSCDEIRNFYRQNLLNNQYPQLQA